MQEVKLIEPTVELKSEFQSMVAEYLAAAERGWLFEQAVDDFKGYVRKLLNHAQGKGLPDGWVRQTDYWLVTQENVILGEGCLRHSLTAALEQEGGHIGYYIRPSQRGKGYGTLLLKLLLEKAREIGLEKVLVTCDDDNIASARIIEKNGGKFADHTVLEKTGKLKSRYWIDLR